MDERLQRAPVGILELTAEGTVTAANDAARRLLTPEGDTGDEPTLTGVGVETAVPPSVEATLPSLFTDTATVEDRQFEEYYPSLDRWLSISVVAAGESVTVYLQDATERHRLDDEIDRLRTDLDRLTLIDDLLSALLLELLEASSREAIAETICERLGEPARYEFVWVGERELGSDLLAVKAAAGTTGETFDAVTASLGEDSVTPAERAVETGEVQIVQQLAGAESVPESVRVAAFSDGVQSLLAVPLAYGDTVYGVVAAYSTDQDAFSERERASFETLGTVAGFAINASRQRDLLFANTVTELTFQVDSPADPLVEASARLDATLSLDGVVPHETDRLLCYLSITDADSEAVVDVLTDAAGVIGARVIEDSTVEVELDSTTPLPTLSSRGGTIRSVTVSDGVSRVVVDCAPEVSLRRLADVMDREFDAAVLSKRTRDRTVTTTQSFRDELGDKLTDRQETALRTAFFSNYFESPRDSSAAEVAASLDIADSTLLYHLRAGQRALLESFFDTDTYDRQRRDAEEPFDRPAMDSDQ
jgi:hypothetical protein